MASHRYEVIEQGKTFAIWDYYDNCTVAYNITSKDKAELVTDALNRSTDIIWNETTKSWENKYVLLGSTTFYEDISDERSGSSEQTNG